MKKTGENPKKERLSWRQFDIDVRKIALWARRKRFTGIYGVPRGGLILATVLSYKLDIPLVLSRDDITPRTLIVDDIVDSGGTMERLSGRFGKKQKTASIFFNADATFHPTFHVRKKKYWVVFPWETDKTSRYDGTT